MCSKWEIHKYALGESADGVIGMTSIVWGSRMLEKYATSHPYL